ncbi:iron-sulfur cluster assembly scaffold protein [Patescibacteria group bacterium]
MSDVSNHNNSESWFYSDIVKDHFFNPRNLMCEEVDENQFDASGSYGSPACGDEMKVWIKIDPKTERIKEFKWRTFGCASAIASTSVASEMVLKDKGMTLDQALELKPQDIIEQLGGLPPRKIHCSVLADKALKIAINQYFKNTNQKNRGR